MKRMVAVMVSMAQAGIGLQQFRAGLYACCSRRADALFELMDAVTARGASPSVAALSLQPVFRRGWGQTYAALSCGSVDEPRLRALLAATLPQAEADPDADVDAVPVFAADVSAWLRPQAHTSGQRVWCHDARRGRGAPPVPGWQYQWLCQLGAPGASWVAVADVARLGIDDNATRHAAAMVHRVWAARGGRPMLAVFDAGYDAFTLTRLLSDLDVLVVVRMRGRQTLYFDPTAEQLAANRRRGGRPRKHGTKLATADTATHPAPHASLTIDDHPRYGRLQIHAWCGLHPRLTSRSGAGRDSLDIVRGTAVKIEVQRLPGRRRDENKPLWLWLAGPHQTQPDHLNLDLIWRAYLRRFTIEHAFRYLKTGLGWTTPAIRHPEQADRWTWLITAAYTQLRLARTLVDDHRLPWQPPQPAHQRTPSRVQQGFRCLNATLPTPAQPPKPAGHHGGRPKGARSTPATKHPPAKKNTTRSPAG